MAVEPRRLTAILLLAGSTAAGAVALFVSWGNLAGREFGDPAFVLQNLGSFFGSDPADAFANNAMLGVGAILLAVAVAFLAVSTIVAIANSAKAFAIVSITDVLALVAVGTYVLGLYNFTQQKGEPSFPVDWGFWLSVTMLVLAFIAPFAVRAPAAPAAPAPFVGTPRVMRVTGPPAPPKRLKCPSCGNLEYVVPGTRPVCTKCGYGAPPGGAPSGEAGSASEADAPAEVPQG